MHIHSGPINLILAHLLSGGRKGPRWRAEEEYIKPYLIRLRAKKHWQAMRARNFVAQSTEARQIRVPSGSPYGRIDHETLQKHMREPRKLQSASADTAPPAWPNATI